MDNGVGYVQIRNFETGGGSRAVQAVDKLLDLGAKSLVFDLRDNPGGLLSELITILDHLPPQGDLFVRRCAFTWRSRRSAVRPDFRVQARTMCVF